MKVTLFTGSAGTFFLQKPTAGCSVGVAAGTGLTAARSKNPRLTSSFFMVGSGWLNGCMQTYCNLSGTTVSRLSKSSTIGRTAGRSVLKVPAGTLRTDGIFRRLAMRQPVSGLHGAVFLPEIEQRRGDARRAHDLRDAGHDRGMLVGDVPVFVDVGGEVV